MEPTLHVVLDRPKIAGNIGAVARLCAVTGAALHACGPFPFVDRDLKHLRRAGLDYWPFVRAHFHRDLETCLSLLARAPYIVEKGGVLAPWDVSLARGDVVVLGPEDGSVDDAVVARHHDRLLTLPMRPGVRSLNLAQCAAVVAFEAVRQQGGIPSLDPDFD
jgi:tRNA (cytidine/uridine-2'-O-)-methyltransferase